MSILIIICLISIASYLVQTNTIKNEARNKTSDNIELAKSSINSTYKDIENIAHEASALYSDNHGQFSNNLSKYVIEHEITSKYPSVAFIGFVESKDIRSTAQDNLILIEPDNENSLKSISTHSLIDTPINNLVDMDKELLASKESGKPALSRPFLQRNILAGQKTFVILSIPVYSGVLATPNKQERIDTFKGSIIIPIAIDLFLRSAQEKSGIFKTLQLLDEEQNIVGSTNYSNSKYTHYNSFETSLSGEKLKIEFDDQNTGISNLLAAQKSTLVTGLGLGIIVFLLFIMMQISERHSRKLTDKAEADTNKATILYENALNNAPIGIALVHNTGNIFFTNDALADFLGVNKHDLINVLLEDYISSDDKFEFLELWKTMEQKRDVRTTREIRFIHPDGEERWGLISAQGVYDDDTFKYYVIQIEDTTERRSIAERLEYQAIHDPLTGLPNRLLFVDRLEVALQRAQRTGLSVTVLFLDIDRFKIINDSLGHAAGDDLLITIADRIRSSVRPNDTIARFGGDEFVILCEDIEDESQTQEIAQRLLEDINKPITLLGDTVYVTTSIGIAKSLTGQDTPETILRDADTAMYHAKDSGRNRAERFNKRSHAHIVASLETGNGIFRALEQNEFRVRYQPIVSLASGRLSGFEALVYWQHPQRGHVGPVEFIELAEETGLIVPLGLWIFERACKDLERWHSMSPQAQHLTMSINLSPRQLVESSFVDDIQKILERTGVNPSKVWFEITESALMNDAQSTISMLDDLRSLGVHFEVDDFGTGFSSMSYLKKFPVDALKIDQGFVDGLGIDPDDSTIVTAIVSLAHALGLQAIAEGVETPLQVAELKTLGCEFVQGYLYARPNDKEHWDEAVASNTLFTFEDQDIG